MRHSALFLVASTLFACTEPSHWSKPTEDAQPARDAQPASDAQPARESGAPGGEVALPAPPAAPSANVALPSPQPTGSLAAAPPQPSGEQRGAMGEGLREADAARGEGTARDVTPPPPSAVASAPSAPSPAASSPAASSAAAPPPGQSSDRLTVRGPVTQGSLVLATIVGEAKRVSFPGHRVHLEPDGTFFVAFPRNAPLSEKMKVTFADGSVHEHTFAVAARTFETDRIDGLPEDEVKLDAKTRKELASEDARIDAVRMKRTAGDCATKGFVWPAKGKITSRYGQPRVLNGEERGIHWGVDIAVPVGTRVTAPACGTVVFAEQDVPLAGATMVIDHGRGVTSTFLHLSGFAKKVGDVVAQGEVVARSGVSGRATGAHLDWRMNYLEVRVDPELLVSGQPGSM